MSAISRQRLRSVALVLVGCIVGAFLVVPVAARVRSAVEPAAVQSRSVSCQGLNFHPIRSDTTYAWTDSTGLYRTSSAGDGWFLCDPGLPNRAVVTRVRFTLFDDNFEDQVVNCGLFRAGLAATDTSYSAMALLPPTGVAAMPGKVRLSTTAISYASVDNARFGYYLECRFDEGGDGVRIYGADVRYDISSANG